MNPITNQVSFFAEGHRHSFGFWFRSLTARPTCIFVPCRKGKTLRSSSEEATKHSSPSSHRHPRDLDRLEPRRRLSAGARDRVGERAGDDRPRIRGMGAAQYRRYACGTCRRGWSRRGRVGESRSGDVRGRLAGPGEGCGRPPGQRPHDDHGPSSGRPASSPQSTAAPKSPVLATPTNRTPNSRLSMNGPTF